ncbi:MAG: hypothetical protein H5U37_03275, partial [Caldisericia bacterium]|nr:hypothetical protein [Caldisericia bacterium]
MLINLFTTLFYISNSSKVIYSSDILTDKLADLLKDWYYKQHSTAFNNIIINVTLAKDIQNIKIENGLIEAVFYVKATMMPKLTFKDISKSPFLKGIQRYLEENKNILIDSQIKTLEILFKEKYEALKESIGKLHEENGIFKIICEISTSGDINESSKRIFYDVSVKGEPLWEEATNLYFITPLSYEEEENMGYEEAKNLIERLYKTIISSNEISPNG